MNFSPVELTLFSLAVFGLLFLNAVFVATEFSLVKLRFTKFESDRAKEARQSKPVAELLEDMSGASKLIRFGAIFCTVGSGFALAPLAIGVANEIGWATEALLGWVMLAAFLIALSAHFVVGELVPRAMGLQHPVDSLGKTLWIVRFFRFLTKPFVWALRSVSSVLIRLLGLDPEEDLDSLDMESQIRTIISDGEGEELPEMAENIVSNVLDLRKRVAHDIMIPRNQLIFFDLEDSIEENLKLARETGHTRFPLCEGDLDHCVGLIHIKDVFRTEKSIEEIDFRELKRPIARFGMDDPLEDVLQLCLKEKHHFALLKDEFEGTVGALTFEDVVEEIVGEIQDEFDKDKEMVRELSDGQYLVDGLTPLHDLSELIGIEVEAEEVSTFGGYITFSLGRMPRVRRDAADARQVDRVVRARLCRDREAEADAER
ncbi:MAG: hemolysin family protein, partial [Verrucomicrobiota bacterium]